MSNFPRSPRILKGGFVRYDQVSPQGKLIAFPYNPEMLVRHLAPAPANSVCGDAQETVDLTLELDTTDALQDAEPGDPVVRFGLHPILTALRTLLEGDDLNLSLFNRFFPPNPGLSRWTLFIWGPNRTIPVKVLSMKITEKAFDVNLNPIRASVELSMQVLTGVDLRARERATQAYMNNKQLMRALAGHVEQELKSDPLGDSEQK
jgi:hypothetical protein